MSKLSKGNTVDIYNSQVNSVGDRSKGTEVNLYNSEVKDALVESRDSLIRWRGQRPHRHGGQSDLENQLDITTYKAGARTKYRVRRGQSETKKRQKICKKQTVRLRKRQEEVLQELKDLSGTFSTYSEAAKKVDMRISEGALRDNLTQIKNSLGGLPNYEKNHIPARNIKYVKSTRNNSYRAIYEVRNETPNEKT